METKICWQCPDCGAFNVDIIEFTDRQVCEGCTHDFGWPELVDYCRDVTITEIPIAEGLDFKKSA